MLNNTDSLSYQACADSFAEFVRNVTAERLSAFAQRRQSYDGQKTPVSFTREIRCLMHIFGDCKKPLWDSVLYMEQILRQQMNLLLSKVTDIATHRGGTEILSDDLLFLLRNNIVKLKRLLLYLSVKDTKEVINKQASSATDALSSPVNGKRVKSALQFLHKIDNVFKYRDIMQKEIPDPTMHRRKERLNAMTLSMNNEDYFEFCKIQGISFLTTDTVEETSNDGRVPKGGVLTFFNWLMEDNVTNLRPTGFALEICNYFAREIIAEIVDLVLLLRIEKSEEDLAARREAEEIREINGSETISSDDEERASTKGSTTSESIEGAITVLEMREVIERYAKNPYKRVLIAAKPSDTLFPDYLLCC